MVKPVRIDFACNDPDTGLFTGRVEAIHLPDGMLELESWGRPRTLAELEGAIRLSGKVWQVLGSRYGVGNWCWNGYWMEPHTAARFLAWLHGRQLFDCTSGWEPLFTLWKWKEPLYPDPLLPLLAEVA